MLAAYDYAQEVDMNASVKSFLRVTFIPFVTLLVIFIYFGLGSNWAGLFFAPRSFLGYGLWIAGGFIAVTLIESLMIWLFTKEDYIECLWASIIANAATVCFNAVIIGAWMFLRVFALLIPVAVGIWMYHIGRVPRWVTIFCLAVLLGVPLILFARLGNIGAIDIMQMRTWIVLAMPVLGGSFLLQGVIVKRKLAKDDVFMAVLISNIFIYIPIVILARLFQGIA
jgi:hypothetical protein